MSRNFTGRYEDDGVEVLFDRRLTQASCRRVPIDDAKIFLREAVPEKNPISGTVIAQAGSRNPSSSKGNNCQRLFRNREGSQGTGAGGGGAVQKPYVMEKIGVAIRDELDRK